MTLDDRAIAISATFTAEAVQPGLAFWAAELGLDHEVRFAAYNQAFQELLDPAGLFARNRGGYNVALVRFEDWQDPQHDVQRFVEAVKSAAATFPAPLILVTCPPTPERAAAHEAAEGVLREGIAGITAVHLIAAAEVLAL